MEIKFLEDSEDVNVYDDRKCPGGMGVFIAGFVIGCIITIAVVMTIIMPALCK